MTISIGEPRLEIPRLPSGKFCSYIQLKWLRDGEIVTLTGVNHPVFKLERSDLVFQHYSYSPAYEKVPDDLIADIAWRIEKSIRMNLDEDMYGVRVLRGQLIRDDLHRPRIKNKKNIRGLQIDYSSLFPRSWF